MEQIILISLGFMLGIYTQFNFALWQSLIRALCFGFYGLKRKAEKRRQVCQGFLKTDGSLSFAIPENMNKSIPLFCEDIIHTFFKDSEYLKRDIHLIKGEYTAYIKIEVDVREGSV